MELAKRPQNALRYWRKIKGKTQGDLAKVIGLDQPTFSKMEQGIVNPTYEQLQIIARELGVLVTDILRDEDLKVAEKLNRG